MGRKRRLIATQSTLITLSKSEEEDDVEWVLLKLKAQSSVEGAGQFHYRMGRETDLYELMIDYTQRIGVPLNSVRFLFDSSPIDPTHSADSLELEDGDSIDAIQRKKLADAEVSEIPLISLPRDENEISITLAVGDHGATFDRMLFYIIGRKTPLGNLFLDYWNRTFQVSEFTCFFNLRVGFRRIKPKSTADGLKMKDGDIICAAPSNEMSLLMN
ncbi:hypothetical protein HRI_001703500 [Hibiscus trionum]|uniref:Ubiquitin-like domain-containing protein n=1 Tax=Hibiscus trionum TaxID=183268 RepID=A0A9W7LWG9_HIBTR|nr:hypothetical protein HRI_001703500 [Hibiscus trionum]